ncbi:helix-turn-helix domain-containing protein [Paraburkholderia phenoliruptrix]|uniref:helix-turn-helix domain-containing protein n=1 Tax=Paraburkholderia phenoliruptrix TaxID=252970 RepID=UPI002855F2B0|nr:helix-turn-helix domain-containing protein [Paraburkholderia phenoliruptrix]MDR6392528.1 AraC-like DNA-binding protein [Paraburkholderia phenoliruptrix]
MTNSAGFSCTRGSTAGVPASERMEYWEALCAATLVGLRCSSLSPSGLEVEKTGIALPDLGIADISGRDHLIERSPAMVRQWPKESLFACQIVSGRAYFIQRDRCLLADAGDVVVYDTRVPYVFGFLTPMRQLLIDLPVTTFDDRIDAELAALPLRIVPTPGVGAMLGSTLRASVERFMKDPGEHDPARFTEHMRMLVSELINTELKGVSVSRTSLSYLLTARQYIAAHLREPDLGPQAIADAVGLSLRHLSRLFSADGESITQYIWSERLSHAYRELTDARLRKTSVGEIAFRWGFSSQAHFSRAIRERYGASPVSLRDAADAAGL